MRSELRLSMGLIGLLALAACGKAPSTNGIPTINGIYIYISGPTPKLQHMAQQLKREYPDHFVSTARTEYATRSQIVFDAVSNPRPGDMLDTGDTGMILNRARAAGLRAELVIR